MNSQCSLEKTPRQTRVCSRLLAVVKDLGDHGVIHANISAWNILRSVGEEMPETRCSQHDISHITRRWRVIDFDWSGSRNRFELQDGNPLDGRKVYWNYTISQFLGTFSE